MSILYAGHPAMPMLMELLGLPRHCVEFTLHCKVGATPSDNIAEITCRYFPDAPTREQFETVTTRFHLVPVEEGVA